MIKCKRRFQTLRLNADVDDVIVLQAKKFVHAIEVINKIVQSSLGLEGNCPCESRPPSLEWIPDADSSIRVKCECVMFVCMFERSVALTNMLGGDARCLQT